MCNYFILKSKITVNHHKNTDCKWLTNVTDQQVKSQTYQHTGLGNTGQPRLNKSGSELREWSPKGSRHGAVQHQEPTTKAFQQVANSSYEWMTPKAIEAPSQEWDHSFHLQKRARKFSISNNKQQWWVPKKIQGLTQREDKTGSGTLVPHATLKIKPAKPRCICKVSTAKTIPTSGQCFRTEQALQA